MRPFFCQVEAVETVIWLTEVARTKRQYGHIWEHILGANEQANPELLRLAMKMATGAGKTTVMAMLIAWQAVNAVRSPTSTNFSRGFLVIAPGITIKDRLRVLFPSDVESYYRAREFVPGDMLDDINKAKIVITNYHALQLKEVLEVNKVGRSLLQGRHAPIATKETEGQMVRRVAEELMGLKNIVVINDEAHHCYREKPNNEDIDELTGDDKAFAKHENEAARLWISGIECFKRKLSVRAVYDLSATPFFLRGSGYAEGTLLARDRAALRRWRSRGIVRFRPAARGHEHGRQERTAWRTGALRRVGCHADRRLGYEHRHPYPGCSRLGTQLLCEQVVGRGLRRYSYDLNTEGLFNVEYADIMGIPFDFTAKPQVAPVKPPKKMTRVAAVRERAAMEMIFPRVVGYRIDLPDEKLQANFAANSQLVLTPDMVGPGQTLLEGIVGEGVTLTVAEMKDKRPSTVSYELAKYLLYSYFKDADGEPKLHLFYQIQRIVRRWIDEGYLECKGGTGPWMLQILGIAAQAAERIYNGIAAAIGDEERIRAVLDPYNPKGSTRHVGFMTSKDLYTTDPAKCHINYVVCDSNWEAEFARAAEAHPRVLSYVKNQGLGLEVPYKDGSTARFYVPDFIVNIDDGRGPDDPLHLIVEVKGYRRENVKLKSETMRQKWIRGVNNLGIYGRWEFEEFNDVFEMQKEFAGLIDRAVRDQANSQEVA